MSDNHAFRQKFGFPYALLSDTDGAMSRDYGAMGEGAARASRVSVLISDDGTVLKTYAKVTPAEHPAEVLADLAALAQTDS